VPDAPLSKRVAGSIPGVAALRLAHNLASACVRAASIGKLILE